MFVGLPASERASDSASACLADLLVLHGADGNPLLGRAATVRQAARRGTSAPTMTHEVAARTSGAGPAPPSTLAVGSALLALYVIWGSTYFAMRVALECFPPFLMGALRFVLSGGMLLAYARFRGAPWPTWRQWGAGALVGTLLFAGGNGGISIAEQSVSSGLAAVVVATMPLFAAVFALLWRERPSLGEWTGLLVGFGGVALLNADGELSASGAMAVALIASPMAWALGSVWSRRLPQPSTAAMTSATQMLTGSVVMGAIALLRGEHVASVITLRAAGAIAYLVVLGSLVGFTAYAFLLRATRPALATSYAYVNPAVALLIGALFGGEHVDATTLFGAAVILVGVAVTSWSARRAAQRAASSLSSP
jgi:drug/metabolite transporter (DMT)-like permease